MIEGEQVTLAIESAIAGGSLSLIWGETEIANWIGTADRSKAEELLVNVDDMLASTDVSRHDIDLIAVSAGPGSFTGIRIGIATALGLKTGLGIPISCVSALEAIACRNAGILPAYVVAVPVGRNSVCIQTFTIDEKKVMKATEPRTIQEHEIEQISETMVMHAALFEKYATLPNAIDFGANVAYAVGMAASPGVVAEPLFISKSF